MPAPSTSVDITLVYCRLVDTESPEYAAISRVKHYDFAMNLIIDAYPARGNSNEDDGNGASPGLAWPAE
jgi:hypothetical protein